MVMWEIPVLGILSVLGGIKTICGLKLLREKEFNFFNVWTEKQMYVLAGGWLVFFGCLWFCTGGSVPLVRTADLLCTYGILAAVDTKCRIVPDTILFCYFFGQMLLGAMSTELAALIQILLTGVGFSVVALCAAWFSKGKLGMGDARLLGITAMTAGWEFVVQILILAVILSFVYSMWLLFICKKSLQTEFPFVPFLAGGMVSYMVFLFG